MYNGLVERCFLSCVDSFRRKTLEKSEEVVRARQLSACCDVPLTLCLLRHASALPSAARSS